MKRALVIVALAALAVGGCYNPTFDNPSCPTGECPSGFTCVQGQCVANGGDDDGGEIDAPNIDATDAPEGIDATDAPMVDAPMVDAPDAAIDAPTDAAIVTHTGSISVLEVGVLQTSGTTQIGQGIVITTHFDSVTADPPVLDTQPGTPFGCKVYVLDTAAEISTSGGIDEGNFTVTVSNGGTPANPTFPVCRFGAGPPGGSVNGYWCPDPGSSATLTVINNAVIQPMTGFAVMTINGGSASFSADDVGRWVYFTGTGDGNYDNQGFAIISFIDSDSVEIAIGGVILTGPSTLQSGQFDTFAGIAIQPGLNDPGQLSDTATVDVMGSGGGGGHVGSFAATVSQVGDDFNLLDAATGDLMRAIPTDGSAFSIGCSSCGSATAMVVDIVTTDANLRSDPFHFPRPVTRSVHVVCTAVLANTITVPASVSSYLTPAMSSRTRVQTIVARSGLATPTTMAGSAVTVVAGHGIVGFSTP